MASHTLHVLQRTLPCFRVAPIAISCPNPQGKGLHIIDPPLYRPLKPLDLMIFL